MQTYRRTSVLLAVASLLVATSPAVAADPKPSVTVTGTGGFTLQEQRTLPDGRIVATFRSKDGTLRTIGRAGMIVNVNVTSRQSDAQGKHGDVQINFEAPAVDKSSSKSRESHGASAVDSLIALGVDPAVAQRDFGDFDAQAPIGSAAPSSATLASYTAPGSEVQPAPAVSTTTPWDTQCANLSYAGGKITGRGCSTLYLVSASGSDWWFQSKYKITASSSDTSLFPVRIRGLGWKLTWNDTDNSVNDWEPHTTIYGTSGCGTVTFGANQGFLIAINFSLCPTKVVPWSLTSVSSGALWSGVEHDTDPVGAAGLQEDHNPPNATTSHYSTFSLTW